MPMIPTYVFPFLFAIAAAIGGFVFSRRHSNDPDSLVSNILYMVAAGCVIVGIATYWMYNNM